MGKGGVIFLGAVFLWANYMSFFRVKKDEYIKTSNITTHTNSIRYHSTGSSVFRGGGFNLGK